MGRSGTGSEWRAASGGRGFSLAAVLLLLSVAGCRPAAVGSTAVVASATTPLPLSPASEEVASATESAGPAADYAGSTVATRSAPEYAYSITDNSMGANATRPAPPTTRHAPPSPTPQATTAPRATRPAPPATATPFPTFTPPPPPPLVAEEHLYWQRPVPAAGPTWTDKSYPYGSTRGGMLRPHHGVEFVVPSGTPVLAVAAGTVRVAGDDSQSAFGPQTDFYGNLIVLELAGTGETPIFALYGHLSEVAVSVGQVVAAGEVLGLSGASGVADGPHLHLEVRVGDNSYDATRNPLLWLSPLPGTGIVAGRVVSASGQLLHEAPIALQRVDGPAPYTATTSYALAGPNADGALGENFVMDDVEPGFYQVVVAAGNQRHTVDLWVYPDRINWVEITITP